MRNFLNLKLMLVMSLVLLVGACNTKKDEIPPNALQVSEAKVSWTGAFAGQLQDKRDIVVTNIADVEIVGVTERLQNGQSSIFLAGSDCSGTLPPLGTCKLTVNFQPDQEKKYYKDKYIFSYETTKEGTSTTAITLQGDSFTDGGVSTDISDLLISGVYAEPFGQSTSFTLNKTLETSPGVTSNAGAIILSYFGTTPMRILIVPSAESNFAISGNTCTGDLLNGQSCMISFNFTPARDGEESTIFDLSGSAGNAKPKILHIKTNGKSVKSGELDGLILEVEPNSIFEDTTVGLVSSPVRMVKLTNNTGRKIFYRPLSTSGSFDIAYNTGAEGTCDGVIKAGDNCTLKAVFAPTFKGVNSGYFRVAVGEKGVYASVEGEGTYTQVTPPPATILISAPKLVFPETELGFQSYTKNVTFTATTDNDNFAVSVKLTDKTKAQLFRYTTTCVNGVPLNKDSNKSCSVSVTYVPTELKTGGDKDEAVLKVTFIKAGYFGEAPTTDIALEGTSRKTFTGNLETPIDNLTVSQKSFSFPDTAIGLTSVFTFTVTNNGENEITGFKTTSDDLITFPLSKDFTTCTSTIAAGASCTVAYLFIARASALKTAYISLGATGIEPDNKIIEMTGRGTLFNKYLNFGYVKDAPKVMAMAYVNDTKAAQVISDIKLVNIYTEWNWDPVKVANTDMFTFDYIKELANPKVPFTMLSNDCTGRPLEAKTSCIIRIQFNPEDTINSVKGYRARILLLDNDSNVLRDSDRNNRIVGQFHATASTDNQSIMYFPTDGEQDGKPILVPGYWAKRTPASQAQVDAITGVIGENYYVYGGLSDYSTNQSHDWNRDPNVATIRVYDAARNMWRMLDPSGKSPVQFYNKDAHASASAAVVNSKLYVFGGGLRTAAWGNAGNAVNYINDVFVYDPTDISVSRDGSWTKIITSGTVTPKQKQGAASTSLGGYLFVFGGINENTLTNEFHALDLRGTDKPAWVALPVGEKSASARSNAAITTYNDKIYIHGGNDTTSREANDLWEYTPVFDNSTGNLIPNKGSWRVIFVGDGKSSQAPDPDKDQVRPSVRIKHTMSVVNGKLVIAGQGFIWPFKPVTSYKKGYFTVTPPPDNITDTSGILLEDIFQPLPAHEEDLNKLGREKHDPNWTGADNPFNVVAGHYSSAIEGVFWFYNVNLMGILIDPR